MDYEVKERYFVTGSLHVACDRCPGGTEGQRESTVMKRGERKLPLAPRF